MTTFCLVLKFLLLLVMEMYGTSVFVRLKAMDFNFQLRWFSLALV